MAGDNPYLEDWERIRHIAASISEREERVRELRGQAYELESRITDLSYEPDDDGNDRNESARSYYYDRLYGIQSEISYTEGLISSARDEAHGMAGNFRQQAGEYGQRAAHTSNAGSGFQSLEGFRFGASSARAGAALAGQRTAHYEDHAAALNELASAAEQAVEGYFAGAGSSAVRERGEYRRQGPDISGGGDGRSKESAYPGEAEEKRGGSGRNIAADAGFARLGAKGDSDSNSGVNFSKISHADVYMVDNNVEGNITASQADAILAGKWEMNSLWRRRMRHLPRNGELQRTCSGSTGMRMVWYGSMIRGQQSWFREVLRGNMPGNRLLRITARRHPAVCCSLQLLKSRWCSSGTKRKILLRE